MLLAVWSIRETNRRRLFFLLSHICLLIGCQDALLLLLHLLLLH